MWCAMYFWSNGLNREFLDNYRELLNGVMEGWKSSTDRLEEINKMANGSKLPDKTESICKLYNLEFIQRKWEGYSEAKNFGNSKAKYDWILSIDADEELSDELKNSILKAKEGSELNAYKFNRFTNYCGKWIKHCGWYPEKKVRIFDRRITKWQGIVHEELKIDSVKPVIHLNGDCFHYSYYSIEEHIQQTEKFTSLSASDLFSKGRKANLINLYVSPLVKFVQSYIFKLGLLDGYSGFVICKISARYTYLKYHKLNLLNKK